MILTKYCFPDLYRKAFYKCMIYRKHYPACNMWLSHTTGKYRGNLFLHKDKLLKHTFSFSGSMSSDAVQGMGLYACTLYFYHFIQVYDIENRSSSGKLNRARLLKYP